MLESLAQRLRRALDTGLVTVLLRRETNFSLVAVAAESEQAIDAARAGHDRSEMQLASDLACRALSGVDPIEAKLEAKSISLGDLAPAGTLIAAPFRTVEAEGAVLIYPRSDRPFSGQEKDLISLATNFAALAIASSEHTAAAQAQTHELHQLLDTASELKSIDSLDQCMQQLALRAADYLGFRARLRGSSGRRQTSDSLGADHGHLRALDLEIPDSPFARALKSGEVILVGET